MHKEEAFISRKSILHAFIHIFHPVVQIGVVAGLFLARDPSIW